MVVVTYIAAKESAVCQALAQVVIRSLLFVSGDVELNPGPVSSNSLMEGLASLGTTAPPGQIKNP